MGIYPKLKSVLTKRRRLHFLTAYGGDSSRETFDGELNYQAGRLFFLTFIGLFVWLAYIPIDLQMHQFPVFVVIARAGLTVVSAIAILMRFTKRFRDKPKTALSLPMAYLYYATAIKTALAGDEISSYVGGFVFILMIPIFAPFPLKFKVINTISSIAIFYLLAFFADVDFFNLSILYSVADLIVVMTISLVFSFSQNALQRRAWMQRLELSETSGALGDARLANLMIDTAPLCSQLWNRNYKLIDCNEEAVRLFGFEDKREFLDRFVSECSPEYQPDGQRSDDLIQFYTNKALEEGRCTLEWMHQMPDGAPLPAEVTLVRVSYKGEYYVVGYTKDLREITRLEAEAEKIYYDGLTGIYNRRYLDENLGQVITSLSRSGGVLSVMMIDLDFFKKYNDTYGHSAGDECLKIVVGVLAECITRTDDFAVRYGGEEFAAVLPNCDESGARKIANKLLENMRSRKIPHVANEVADFFTFSIGVATSHVKHGQRAEDYIKKADEMLYKSKQSGRNRYSLGSL